VAPSSTTDLYDAIAPIYDEWQSWNGMTPFARVAAAKLAPVLDREAAAAAGTGGHRPAFLDIGCGTGALLADVRGARPIWRLAGVDASAGMLAVARGKLAGAPDVTLARANLDALPFPTAFDVCSSFYDTLNHLPDAQALTGAFAAAAAVLRPGGLLAFDVTSRRGFEEWWQTSDTFDGAGWRLVVDADFDLTTEIATAKMTIERDGRIAHHEVRERYFARDAIAAALVAAGFIVEKSEAWSPFPVGSLGKAWWEARLR
jgi:SAM-dependent methyltransferase